MLIADRNWRLENLYKIVTKSGEKVTFRANSIQKILNDSKSKRKMILKARQFGISTNEILKQFDAVCYTRNFTACILAHEADAIEKLFRIVLRAYKFMPEEIRPKVDRGGGSKFELYFPENNSRIYCDLESRGDTIQWLHASEVAFMKDTARLYSTLQAVPIETGIATLETTPNGMGNHFYDMWTDPDSPYEKLFFPWYLHDEYKLPVFGKFERTKEEEELAHKALNLFAHKITNVQLNFRRMKKAELRNNNTEGKRVTFEQEYPEDDVTCFLTSGESVMDLAKVKRMIDSAKPPIFDNGYMKIYEEPKSTHRYVCGADTAEGVGGDFSVGVVIDTKLKRVVGMVRGQFKPYDFAYILDELCKKFTFPGRPVPELAVERNNHGHAVILALENIIQYSALYKHPDERLGWKTDNVTRPVMLNALINGIENNYLKIDDKVILGECLTLVNIGGKIQAAEGKHDDAVIATAIAYQLALSFGDGSFYENIENKILL